MGSFVKYLGILFLHFFVFDEACGRECLSLYLHVMYVRTCSYGWIGKQMGSDTKSFRKKLSVTCPVKEKQRTADLQTP